MSGQRPGEAAATEAVAALIAARGISGPALSTAIADEYVAAVYPLIERAVREQVEREHAAARIRAAVEREARWDGVWDT